MSAKIDPRKREAIRAALLQRFASGVLEDAGEVISVESPDLTYLEGNALAVILAAAEQRAAGAFGAILPDKAIGDSQRHHASVLDLAMAPGEAPAAFAQRIVAERQLRLGDGRPADWIAWAKAVTGISDAYFYATLPVGSALPGTLGTGILVVLGPPQGSSPINTRIVASVTNPSGYIDGTRDANGNVISNGRQLRPVAAPLATNVALEAAAFSVVNVAFSISNTPAFEFPWAPYAGLAVVSSTVTTVTVAGDRSALAGLPMLLNVGTANARGAYVKAAPTTAVFGGVNTVFTFANAFAAAPTGTVYPAPANWPDIRDAIFDLFDRFGPGDTVPPSRYPPPDLSGPTILYRSQLIRRILSVPGVTNCAVTAPAASSTAPGIKALLQLGTLTITRT